MRSMAKKPVCARFLDVTVTAEEPTLWKWHISEQAVQVMHGYTTSRETAQIDADSALFKLLSIGKT